MAEKKESGRGQIITFYSYKGGSGRTMALVNTACLLAREKNKKILVIDWDLEAPGVHRYFDSEARRSEQKRTEILRIDDASPGLIELFMSLRDQLAKKKGQSADSILKVIKDAQLDTYLTKVIEPSLFVLKAGIFDHDYAEKVNQFNWFDFYSSTPEFFSVFASYLEGKFDYILIDSRTGISDSSGICTMIMPEKIVPVFTPNKQSLDGVLSVMKRAVNYRMDSSDLRPLGIFPLPSRIEMAENDLREVWRKGNKAVKISGYQNEFEALLSQAYQLTDCDLNAYFDDVQIQHVPKYSYGESIAVLEEVLEDSLSLTRSYKTFTEKLTGQKNIWETSPFKVFISYSKNDHDYVTELRKHLTHQNLVVSTLDTIKTGEEWSKAVVKNIQDSDIMVSVVSGSSINSSIHAYEAGLAKSAGKKVISIVTDNTIGTVPIYMESTPSIQSEETHINQVVKQIVAAMYKK